MSPEQEARLRHKAQRHPDSFGSCGYIECRAARAAAPTEPGTCRGCGARMVAGHLDLNPGCAAVYAVPPSPDRGAGLRARQVALLNQYVGPDMTGEPTLLFPGSAEDLLDRLAALIDSEETEQHGDQAEPPPDKCGHIHCRERAAAALIDSEKLDAAWAEAEAALPDGYRIDLTWPYSTRENPTPRYHASARRVSDYLGYIGHNDGGPTPAAALRALAARLTKHPEEPA